MFEFVSIRQTWRQERVFFLFDDATLTSLPTAWTDVVAQDAFVAVAAGRSALRVEDLVALAEMIDGLGPATATMRRVRRTTPSM